MVRKAAGFTVCFIAIFVLPVWAAENARLVLVRANVGIGVRGENSKITLTSTQPIGYVASTPGSSLAALYPGFLAPATDRAGLITLARLQDVYLERAAAPEPIAADFAGNRDGLLNSTDFVTLVNKGLP